LRRIFLTGFMGSGKTTVGRLLADRLGWEFHDLDAAIEAEAGMDIPGIFALEGEEGFRRREAEALAAARPLHGVHGLGGGALQGPGARESLRGLGLLVYLRARPATLAARLAGVQEGRPMLAGEDGPAGREERISRLLSFRESCYLAADLVVDTDGLSPRQVAQRIAILVRDPAGGGVET
jgi:shikimate kinase